MVFTRSIMTLELSISIEIDPGTFKSKICGFVLYICVFYDIHIIFEYLFIYYDRFIEFRIDLHAPYMIQGMRKE